MANTNGVLLSESAARKTAEVVRIVLSRGNPRPWPSLIPPILSGSAGSTAVLGKVVDFDWENYVVWVAPIFGDVDPTDRLVWGAFTAEGSDAFDFANVIKCFAGVGALTTIGTPCLVTTAVNCRYPIAQPMYNFGADPADPLFRAAEPCESIRAAADPTVLTEIGYGDQCTACSDPDPVNRGGCWSRSGGQGYPDENLYVVGACVIGDPPDQSCSQKTEAACARAGGTYQGDGTSCP